MPGIEIPIWVQMEDQTEYQITVDQRDIAAFEVQPFGVTFSKAATVLHTFTRWTAWHALTRTKKIKMSWGVFSEQCVFASDVDPAELDKAVEPDPTRPDLSGDTSSS